MPSMAKKSNERETVSEKFGDTARTAREHIFGGTAPSYSGFIASHPRP